MEWLRYKTSANVVLGQFVDKSNAASAETGLTPSVALSKAGAAFVARNSSRSAAHYIGGFYKVPLNSVDAGTLGRMKAVVFAPNTHLGVWQDFMVLRSQAYDSLFLHPGGSAMVSAAVKKALTDQSLDAFTAAVSGAARRALVDIDLDHLLNSNAGTAIPRSNSVMNMIMTSVATSTFARNQHSLKAILSQGNAAWVTGNFATQAMLESARAQLAAYHPTSVQVSAAMNRAFVNHSLDAFSVGVSAKVQAVIVANNLDHLMKASAPAGVPASNTVLERIMVSSAAGTFTPGTHSLKAIRGAIAGISAGGGASTAAVSNAVRNNITNYHLDHLMHTSAPVGLPVSNSLLNVIMLSAAGGTFDRTKHSLKGIRQYVRADIESNRLLTATSAAISGTVKHALTDIRLERLLAASATVSTVVRSNSIFNRIMVSGGTSIYSQAKGNFRSIWNKAGSTVSGAVSPGDISNIADEVWQKSRAATGIAPSGSFGEAIVLTYGSGNKPVNHHTGGTDNLRIVDQAGAGIDEVRIRIYLKSDYNSGLITLPYIKGQSISKADGRWVHPVYLDSGLSYVAAFEKGTVMARTTAEFVP